MAKTDRKPGTPTASGRKSGGDDRQTRLASALRANLKKRKAQMRSRKQAEENTIDSEE